MLFYVLKRLGLLSDAVKEDPRRQHIVISNHDEVQSALAMADVYDAKQVFVDTPRGRH